MILIRNLLEILLLIILMLIILLGIPLLMIMGFNTLMSFLFIGHVAIAINVYTWALSFFIFIIILWLTT